MKEDKKLLEEGGGSVVEVSCLGLELASGLGSGLGLALGLGLGLRSGLGLWLGRRGELLRAYVYARGRMRGYQVSLHLALGLGKVG